MGQIETRTPPDTKALLTELRRYGVRYLMSEATELTDRDIQFQPAEFVAALARSSDPRVRDTLISLLLLHPDLASAAEEAIEVSRLSGDEQIAEQLITLALAKIERGSSRDLHDIALLQQNGLIQRNDLETAFQAILPQLGHGRFFNVDPALFSQKVSAAVNTLWGSQP
jgi:hypothetical protein